MLDSRPRCRFTLWRHRRRGRFRLDQNPESTLTKLKYSLLACFLSTVLMVVLPSNGFAQSEQGQSREAANLAPQGQPRDTSQPQEDTALSAEPQRAQNLTLASTTIRTETALLSFNFDFFQGFEPTTVVCPADHKAGCTIRVEVSAVIWAVTPKNVAQLNVFINGAGQPVDPNQFINIDSTTTGPFASAHTYQWMKRGIPAGSTQTVNIDFTMFLKGGSADTGFRTATIELYLN